MADRSSLVRLLANVTDFKAQMESARRSVKGVGDEADKQSKQASTALGRMTQSAQQNRESWNDAGTALTAFGAVTVGALGMAVRAAVQWESAWAGVTKTVNGSDAELADIERGLRGLARTLPATHGEIAAVAEAAGQLGVETGSIVAFTKTMVDLGETTNLSAEEAATSLAQLMNVMQTAPDDVGRLGASLVALGNAGASTEADILNMASYITGSARLIGASESDVLALANAMTSMGINAERGGGVMTRVMQDIYSAVQSGGAEMEGFAKVAGMSSAEFARAFEADPIRALDSFVQGLNKVESSGGNVVATLGELGIKGTQDTAVLLQMKGAGDLLTESLDLGNKSWRENTALVEEAAKRYDTTAAKMEIARNNITEAGIEIGEVFLPILSSLAESVSGVAQGFADLPDPVQATVGGLAGVAGVGALAGGAFLLLFPRVIETYKAFQTLREVSPGLASGLGKVGRAAGIAGAIIAVGSAFDGMLESMGPAAPTMAETTEAMLTMGTSMASIDKQFQGLSRWGYDVEGFAHAMDRLNKPSGWDRAADIAKEITSFGSAEGSAGRERLIEQIGRMDEQLAFFVESGHPELAAEQFEAMNAALEAEGVHIEDLAKEFPVYQEALEGVENEQRIAAESADLQAQATARLRTEAGAAYGSLETYAAALGMSEEATQELIDKSNELGESLAAFIDPLGAYTGLLEEKKEADRLAAQATADATTSSSDSWEDYVTNVDVSVAEYMAVLREQLTAQQDWQLNMLILASRVSEGTLAELARMGPEGAPLIADLVNQSDDILGELDVIVAARAKEATDAWGATMTLAAPVLAAIGKKAGQGVVAELSAQLLAGTTTVAQIAAQYGISLAGGINPILTSLGKRPIAGVGGRVGGLLEADGGVVDVYPERLAHYANGGLPEQHIAQIAQPGDWRLWAEPETGGPAYIPLAHHRRLETTP